jgi:release factor glutamine methyltransferase
MAERIAIHAPAVRATVNTATVSGLLREVDAILRAAQIENSGAEARDTVATVAGVGRFWPVLNGDATVTEELRDRALIAAQKRSRGAPFAYAVGEAAFRHLTLAVDERVLIPRQETEVLVGLALKRIAQSTLHGIVADIGTGSGAIALALATESDSGTISRIIATDISGAALDVATANARRVLPSDSPRVEFRCGDMFSVISETGLSAVISNPPYIAFEEARTLPASVRNWEPPVALYADRQGMGAIERLVKGSARALAQGGLLAIEVDSGRASIAAELVLTHGAFRDVGVENDLTGRERFVLATKYRGG